MNFWTVVTQEKCDPKKQFFKKKCCANLYKGFFPGKNGPQESPYFEEKKKKSEFRHL
jgi:hypothetical protein